MGKEKNSRSGVTGKLQKEEKRIPLLRREKKACNRVSDLWDKAEIGGLILLRLETTKIAKTWSVRRRVLERGKTHKQSNKLQIPTHWGVPAYWIIPMLYIIYDGEEEEKREENGNIGILSGVLEAIVS